MRPTKPFLLITTRAQPRILASEVEVYRRFTRLDEPSLRHFRLDKEPLPEIDTTAWSGIILCGSPFNSLVPQSRKSALQKRVEDDIRRLLDTIVPLDFPFLGVCYGVGTLLAHQGGEIGCRYGEQISAPEITLTSEGVADPLLAGIPPTFNAYVGHTEAAESLPPSAVLLASSAPCPIQMFRVGENMYGTQFHPELDWEALHLRILEYTDKGYYPLDQQQQIIDSCKRAKVEQSHKILANFVARYAV